MCTAKRYIDSVTLPDAHDPALERGRLCVVIATIVINVIAVSLLTFASWSDWRTGAALNFVDNCLLVGFTVVRRDALLARFLLFGVVVGFTELAADAWLVDYTRTLDYSIGCGPMSWRSPLWMPLAWESGGGAIRIHRAAFVGAFWQDRPVNDRIARRHQHSILRRNGAPNSLVAVQPRKRSGNDFVYAVVHHRRRIWHCSGVRIAGANPSARFVARRRCCRRRWRSIDFCLLRRRLSDYRSIN